MKIYIVDTTIIDENGQMAVFEERFLDKDAANEMIDDQIKVEKPYAETISDKRYDRIVDRIVKITFKEHKWYHGSYNKKIVLYTSEVQ